MSGAASGTAMSEFSASVCHVSIRFGHFVIDNTAFPLAVANGDDPFERTSVASTFGHSNAILSASVQSSEGSPMESASYTLPGGICAVDRGRNIGEGFTIGRERNKTGQHADHYCRWRAGRT